MQVTWDERGLVPAVAQDARTGAVLMVAWMNAESLARTQAEGVAWFWSRSRQALWKKGETSGNVLAVRELRADCDGDTLLLLVDPIGPACHTGRTSCFFVDAGGAETDVVAEPAGAIVERLFQLALARRGAGATAEKSYTRALLDGGAAKIGAKITEEAGELVAELGPGTEERVVSETADLLFHVLVGLASRGVDPERVWQELRRRSGTSGHDEKRARPK